VEVEHGPTPWPVGAAGAPLIAFEDVAAASSSDGSSVRWHTVAVSPEVLLLVAVEELTPSEAATVCGISPESLRKRLSAGAAMLGDALRSRTRAGA